ncbi:unnamed protein product [Withania somnifera]
MADSGRLQHRKLEYKRLVPSFLLSHHTILTLLWIVAFILIFVWQRTAVERLLINRGLPPPSRPMPKLRPLVFNLSDFGAVGDGVTVNTKAFERAIWEIRKRGGGQLNVEPGYWLTAPFNLTSHMTLFLAESAVIIGMGDESYWPLLPPLPSYGYGRERPGPMGKILRIQGRSWWEKYRKIFLNYTRGPLLQLMWLRDIHISDVSFRDSPNVTILAPLTEAPNTDGIDPDSCVDMVIEDSYISVGDDGVAIKSGWDQYGIAYSRPSSNITIRNLTVRSMISAGLSIGSEMSGGVSNIIVENLLVWNSKRGIRIKTSPGRGGYIRQVIYRNLTLQNVRVGYDPKAFPIIEDISFTGIRGQGVRIPARIYGSPEIPVQNVTFQDMTVGITYKKKHIFQCSYVQGRVIGKIFPAPCESLDWYDDGGKLLRQSTKRIRRTWIMMVEMKVLYSVNENVGTTADQLVASDI